jgi:predicted porin
MKKNILATAVAVAAVAAPALTSADAVIYGRIYGQMVWNDTNSITAWPTDGRSLDDDQSMGRIGFKFSEDLGGGLSAVGVYEFQLDAMDGEGINRARQQWLGLKHRDWGQFSAGGFDSAYKTHGGTSYDPFAWTALQAREFGGMSQGTFGTTSFFRNAIEYKSPEFWGFTFQGQYSPDQNGNTEGSNNLGASGDYSLGARYDGGFFEIIGAYSYQKRATVALPPAIGFIPAVDPVSGTGGTVPVLISRGSTTVKNEDRNWKVGGKLDLGNWAVTAQYENVHIPSAGFGTNDRATVLAGENIPDTGKYYFGGLQYMWGNLLLVGQGGRFDANNEGDSNYYAAGGRYFFSKRSSLYAGWRRTDADQDIWSNDNVWMMGIRQDF